MIDLRLLRIGYYAYDDSNASDDFLPLLRRIIDAPLWLLATPLYWYTMSAQAKTFIDRLSDLLTTQRELGHRLRGKSLAVICSGTDPALPAGFEEPFKLTCSYLGMRYLGAHYARFEGERFGSATAVAAAVAFGERSLRTIREP